MLLQQALSNILTVTLASIKNDSAIVVNGHTYKLADSTKYVGVNVGSIATVSDLDSLSAYLKTASAKAWVLYNNETNTVLYVYVDTLSASIDASLTSVTGTGVTGAASPYTVSVVKATDLTITVTPKDAGAKLSSVAGTTNVTATKLSDTTFKINGTAAHTAEAVTFTVIAADGMTTATYTVNVTTTET